MTFLLMLPLNLCPVRTTNIPIFIEMFSKSALSKKNTAIKKIKKDLAMLFLPITKINGFDCIYMFAYLQKYFYQILPTSNSKFKQP